MFLKRVEDSDHEVYEFKCPACGLNHRVYSPAWKITSGKTVSINIPIITRTSQTFCHLVIKNSQIYYFPDCSHSLAGKTIDMIEMETVNS